MTTDDLKPKEKYLLETADHANDSQEGREQQAKHLDERKSS